MQGAIGPTGAECLKVLFNQNNHLVLCARHAMGRVTPRCFSHPHLTSRSLLPTLASQPFQRYLHYLTSAHQPLVA